MSKNKRSDYTTNENKITAINEKKKDYKVKVTTYITGSLKDAFLDDCLEKESLETQAARSILGIYYQDILPMIPNNNRMEFIEIKRFIKENIKFK